MVTEILNFYGLAGLSLVPPETLGDLIPYALDLTIGLVLTCAVLRLVGIIVRSLMDGRRF